MMAHVAITRYGNEALFKNKPMVKEGNLSYSGEMILLPSRFYQEANREGFEIR